MHPGKKNIPKILLILVLGFSVFLVIIILIAGYLIWNAPPFDSRTPSQIEATLEAERFLTKTYGKEVQEVIGQFETNWFSYEAHKNPSMQSELATEQFLNYWGFQSRGKAIYDEPFWLITKSAVVTQIRILEYHADRFDAIAHVSEDIDWITPEGKLIQTVPLYHSCGLYVYTREDEKWKMAAYFNATDTTNLDRDWDEAPDWLRQTIGVLPIEALKDCKK
jgi:hypothetical protein